MSAFRYRLKQHIAPLHSRLESHERLQAYARHDGSESDYLAVLHGLYGFWSHNVPATTRLPATFHRFYHAYLAAMADDLEYHPVSADEGPVCAYRHEIAFFYVLLGSSLGARMLLQRRRASQLPQQHLKILAESGGQHWKEFLTSHMVDIETEQEPEILETTEEMFRQLYRNISVADLRSL